MRRPLALTAALCLCAAPLAAEEATEAQIAFVEGNVLSIFYHEFGHALVDILQLPVLGQEEDAADILSVVLTHELWDEDMARDTAWAAALSWRMTADEAGPEIDEETMPACMAGPAAPLHHGLPVLRREPRGAAGFRDRIRPARRTRRRLRRGIRPGGRQLGRLPGPDRRGRAGQSITMQVDPADSISILLGDEVAALNQVFVLPAALKVELAACGEENAFSTIRRPDHHLLHRICRLPLGAGAAGGL